MCCTSATGSSHEVTGTEELSDVGQLDVAARQRLGQGVGVSEGGVRECGQRHRGMARWKKSHQASRGHTRPQRVAKSFPSWNAYTNPGGVTGGRPSNWEGFAQTSASRNEESLGGGKRRQGSPASGRRKSPPPILVRQPDGSHTRKRPDDPGHAPAEAVEGAERRAEG